MTVGDLTKYLEDWAPPGAAWERDNVGLQVGSKRQKIKNIMLALELNEEVLKEALQKNCNFIFTHHPFIFNPIKRLDTGNDPKAKLLQSLFKNDVTVYSAHTNLDYTKDGVSYALARALKLKNINFLELEDGNQFKIAVFVPAENVNEVANSIFSAGGGIIGEYANCSFQSNGVGTFEGSGKSNPAVGKKKRFEKVNEVRLETLVNTWNLNKVIAAIKKSHPYEEPAYDIYPLKNKNVNFGMGAFGVLEKEMNEKAFLAHVCKSLKIKTIKFCEGKSKKIGKVAVCGGAGSEYIEKAIACGADAFITADIKYHSYHDAAGRVLLVDAGHYETEIISLDTVKKKIEKFIGPELKTKVLKYTGNTNPAKFFKL
jgi:dinuclear metal center YbgI/SA1388 family protein